MVTEYDFFLQESLVEEMEKKHHFVMWCERVSEQSAQIQKLSENSEIQCQSSGNI